jgi:endonuclease/exonuclease/phosphatase family metal-dependent hydrolase
MRNSLTVATYNIHKGLSPLNRRLVIHELRERLHRIDADLVFLQEVQGAHALRAHRFDDWPTAPQHEHIADGRYTEIVYGLNAAHRHGHHGNAILSAFPIAEWRNHDVSHHRFENRGHLLARIEVPGWTLPIVCVCVHLGLLHRSRVQQVERLIELLAQNTTPDTPILIAGDFNDWRAQHSGLSARLQEALGLQEAFELAHGAPARTFPSLLPVLTLDRIYVRGLRVTQAERLHDRGAGARWRRLSDHVGLAVTLERT